MSLEEKVRYYWLISHELRQLKQTDVDNLLTSIVNLLEQDLHERLAHRVRELYESASAKLAVAS